MLVLMGNAIGQSRSLNHANFPFSCEVVTGQQHSMTGQYSGAVQANIIQHLAATHQHSATYSKSALGHISLVNVNVTVIGQPVQCSTESEVPVRPKLPISIKLSLVAF